jgi:hypothetical protein
MAVPQSIAFLVAHGFEKLVDPDGGIDGETLLVQRLDLDRPRAGLQDSPEASDTHGRASRTKSISLRQERTAGEASVQD